MISLPSINIKRKIRALIRKPKLSLVVIVYRMPAQARKTLFSLSADYQRGVDPDDYEVIVVENSSDQLMGEEGIQGLRGNFRYVLREERLPTPVPAIHEGFKRSGGDRVGIMIDGARMATPGMIRHIILAGNMSRNTVVSVPGYHIGHKVQQEAKDSGYDERVEQQLLESISWPEDGYRLFTISCMSATSRSGFFRPMGESNCFCVPRHIWKRLGGIDLRFTATGGGQANLDFYKRVCELEYVDLVLLGGEGTFHQFHGGVTTGGTTGDERNKIMQDHFEEYRSIRGGYYRAPIKRPMIFGTIKDPALEFMDHSVRAAIGARKKNVPQATS